MNVLNVFCFILLNAFKELHCAPFYWSYMLHVRSLEKMTRTGERHYEKGPLHVLTICKMFSSSDSFLLPKKTRSKQKQNMTCAEVAYIGCESSFLTNTFWLQESRKNLEMIYHYWNGKKIVSTEVPNSGKLKTEARTIQTKIGLVLRLMHLIVHHAWK